MFTVSIVIDEVIDALKSYISLFTPGVEIIRAQINRVTYPKNDFVLLTDMGQIEIETPTLNFIPDEGSIKILNPTKIAIKCDFFGENSGNYIRAFLSGFRSYYSYDKFPENIKLLYFEEAFQRPLITDQNQYSDKWSVIVYLQYNPVVEVPQDSAIELKNNLFINVDTTIE